MKKVISILLVILWMFVIYTLSDMHGVESTKTSIKSINTTITSVVDVTNKVGITTSSPSQEKRINKISKKLNLPVRKLAHITEYLILTLLLINLFTVFNLDYKKIIILSIIICFLYACSDEIHQSFTERTSSFTDVLIDSIGAIIATFISLKINRKSLKDLK